MQTLRRRDTYTPQDAPQVLGNCDHGLNRERALSVRGLKTLPNNLEEDQSQHRANSNLRVSGIVYVLNMRNLPLMPTTPTKAARLLKAGKAIVVKRFPFTIKLNYATGENKQRVTLGLDPGYGYIGFSATSKKKELIAIELELDQKTSKRLDNKRMYRKGRRNKLRYRQPRFLNRKKAPGWLPPSIERRYQAHLSLIKKICQVLPISKIRVEIANFDIQKLENPDIKGKQYQQGSLYNYQNVRSYLFAREKGKCEHCKKDFSKNNSSHIHHRKPRSSKGSNRLENLMLLHASCHNQIHKSPKLLKKYQKCNVKNYKASTFMSIIRNRFYKDIPELKVTYGYKTNIKRNKLGLEKSHVNDAFVIAKGKHQERAAPWEIKQKHRNNRILQRNNRKGHKPLIRKQHYKIQPLDLLTIGGKEYISKGVGTYGKQVLVENSKKSFSTKHVEKHFSFGSFAWRRV